MFPWQVACRRLLAGGAVALCCAAAARAADTSVWQYTPYRVQVMVAASPQPALGAGLQSRLCASLTERINASIGAPWRGVVAPAPDALQRAMRGGAENVKVDQIPLSSPEPDKVLLIAVAAVPGGFQVTARDFDVRTRTLGATVSRPAWQIGAISETAWNAMLSAFAPLARIDRVEKEGTFMRLKASGLPLRDPDLKLLCEGDVLRPIVRGNDRDGNFRRATAVPWTFYNVTKITPGEIVCQAQSGLRGAGYSRSRGRSESLALRVVPPGGTTTLVLRSRTPPKPFLAGYQVYAHPPGAPETVLLGQTDRRGRLAVPSAASPLRVLVVKNGGELLARLPVVPGLEASATAEIANDDPRLRAEGFIFGLQEELVDLVARREVLMARLRSRLQAQELDKAQQFLDELRRLPGSAEFSQRLADEQVKLASGDPIVQHKIDSLLADTRKLVDKHLDPHGIEQLARELVRAKDAGGKPAPSP